MCLPSPSLSCYFTEITSLAIPQESRLNLLLSSDLANDVNCSSSMLQKQSRKVPVLCDSCCCLCTLTPLLGHQTPTPVLHNQIVLTLPTYMGADRCQWCHHPKPEHGGGAAPVLYYVHMTRPRPFPETADGPHSGHSHIPLGTLSLCYVYYSTTDPRPGHPPI